VRKLYYIIIGLLFFSCTIGTEVYYSDLSLDFFFDKWWGVEENAYFNEGDCFFFDTSSMKVKMYDSVDDTRFETNFTWEVIDGHIEVSGEGVNLDISPYGSCDDYSVRITGLTLTDESSLYECEF